MKTLKLKSDKYRKARGGYSRFLDIYCDHCGKKVLVYQKDGPGELKRLYIDRISSDKPIRSIASLKCPHCGRELGIFYLYPKEKRPAFRLFAGAIQKKVTKRKKTPTS